MYGEYAMDTRKFWNGVLNRINIYGTGTADRISIGYYAGSGNQIRAKYVKDGTEVYDTIGRFEGNTDGVYKGCISLARGIAYFVCKWRKDQAETTPPSSAVFNDNALEKIIFGRPEEDQFF